MTSLRAFRDFCAAQPAEREYNYLDNYNCPIAQFLKSLGYRNVYIRGWGRWCHGNTDGEPLTRHAKLANGYGELRTFGALTARLDAALAEDLA